MGNSFFAYPAQAYAAMRIIVGVLFLCHGLQRLFGLFGGVNGTAVPLLSLLGIAGLLELITGAYSTAKASFIASGEMAVAYFVVIFPSVCGRFKITVSWPSSTLLSSFIWQQRGAAE